MMKTNKIISSIMMLLLLFSYGCANTEVNKQEDYEKCTSVCAAIVESPEIEEGFVALELCRQECEKKFLEN